MSMWLLIPSLFVGFFGHITAVVAATVAATSDVPEASKGLASGLMTTSQRVASTIGIPGLAAVMTIRPDLLSGCPSRVGRSGALAPAGGRMLSCR
jgi:hypothetical protein